MDFMEYIGNFLKTETPFMLLFVSLFFYFIKTAKDRESENHKLVDERLNSIQQDMRVLIQVWKILLEKELEARQK